MRVMVIVSDIVIVLVAMGASVICICSGIELGDEIVIVMGLVVGQRL